MSLVTELNWKSQVEYIEFTDKSTDLKANTVISAALAFVASTLYQL
jgi:hypothetical protein